MNKGLAAGTQAVKPVISTNLIEARQNVLSCYRKLQRITPVFWWDFHLQDMPLPVFRQVLKNQFMKNKNIKDVRIIDRKVVEAHEHITSIQLGFYNPYVVRNWLFAENVEPKSKDFLTRFLSGKK